MSDTMDWIFSFALWDGEISIPGLSASDDGQEVGVGIRTMLGESAQFEVTFSDKMGTTGDWEMETIVGVSWNINDSMSFVYQQWDEADMTAVGIRMDL